MSRKAPYNPVIRKRALLRRKDMSRHYSTKDFFRQMPNELLARYFQKKGLLSDFDFLTRKNSRSDKLFTAWLTLPLEDRNEIDAEFQDIFDMCCEKGSRAIFDELHWQMRASPEVLAQSIEALAALPNHYYRAMVTYLDHFECWKGATHFYHADTLSYWRKRKHMGHKPAIIDEVSIEQLAQQIRDYFHRMEGRGNNCVVEPFKRGDLDYFFAYPEDYSQQSIEWVRGKFGRRPHNPAFEVVYVYSQKEGTLDLNFQGSYKAMEPLQRMFATTILKFDGLLPEPEDTRVYDLNPLRQRNFHFSCSLDNGIKSVAIKKLRFSSRVNKGDRITVEADTTQDANKIYILLDSISKAVPLHLYNITQVELTALVAIDARKPAKTITIRITQPNSCSLKYDELGLKLRNMLEASGIELKEPMEEIKTVESIEV